MVLAAGWAYISSFKIFNAEIWAPFPSRPLRYKTFHHLLHDIGLGYLERVPKSWRTSKAMDNGIESVACLPFQNFKQGRREVVIDGKVNWFQLVNWLGGFMVSLWIQVVRYRFEDIRYGRREVVIDGKVAGFKAGRLHSQSLDSGCKYKFGSNVLFFVGK